MAGEDPRPEVRRRAITHFAWPRPTTFLSQPTLNPFGGPRFLPRYLRSLHDAASCSHISRVITRIALAPIRDYRNWPHLSNPETKSYRGSEPYSVERIKGRVLYIHPCESPFPCTPPSALKIGRIQSSNGAVGNDSPTIIDGTRGQLIFPSPNLHSFRSPSPHNHFPASNTQQRTPADLNFSFPLPSPQSTRPPCHSSVDLRPD